MEGDFNTLLTPMDRSFRQKISKETQALNDTLDQMDLTDIYRTFHRKAAEYTFFSRWTTSWATNQASVNLRKLKSYQASFQTTMLWDYKFTGKKTLKNTNVEAKQYVTKQPMDHWRNQEIKKIPREKWQQKHDDLKLTGHSKSSTKREVYSNKILPQETRKISNLTLHLKQLEKEQTKSKVSRRKQIIKIRAPQGTQYSVINFMGKESKNEKKISILLYIYIKQIHFAVHLKLTQHCKSTICQ